MGLYDLSVVPCTRVWHRAQALAPASARAQVALSMMSRRKWMVVWPKKVDGDEQRMDDF